MDYRDPSASLHAQIDSLQRDNAALREEVAALKATGAAVPKLPYTSTWRVIRGDMAPPAWLLAVLAGLVVLMLYGLYDCIRGLLR